jgi:hypothetical protein
MSIAQRFVACEGDVHPLATETSAAENDSQAHVEYSCDTTNLPWVIFRAAHRAANLQGLPARSRAVLAALARTVDASRPYAAIFARRELLTGRAMQSMRTFYRSLDDLQAAGLIERAPQKRYGEAGLFGRAYLHLTEQAAQLLGLAAPVQPVIESNAVMHAEASAPVPSNPPSANVADGAIYKDLSPGSFQKRQPGQLPGDLQRLRSLGFREFLIFKLMKEARQHGKLLSDVVEATWQHLKRANRPICYLRSLLGSTTDFRHQVQTKRAAADNARREQLEATVVKETLMRCAGGVFFDANGERRIVVGESGESMTVHDFREATPRVAAGAWEPAFVGALEAGRIRSATPDDEERFAACRHAQMSQRPPHVVAASQALPTRELTAHVGAHLAQLKNVLRAARPGLSPS